MIKILFLILLTTSLSAQPGTIELLSVVKGEGTDTYTANIQTLILMSLLPFLSAAVVMLTPFMRCLIVFGLLRQALGTMHSPPNQVIIAISMMISAIVMKPTFDVVYEQAYKPYMAGELASDAAASLAVTNMKKFWLSVTHEEELFYFAELMEVDAVDDLNELPLRVVVPAFVYSELKLAFKIAFLIFIPFLVIDIVVASTLMGMGMMMLSPMIVSLPFKIFAFIALDGWGLLTTSMIGSYKVL